MARRGRHRKPPPRGRRWWLIGGILGATAAGLGWGASVSDPPKDPQTPEAQPSTPAPATTSPTGNTAAAKPTPSREASPSPSPTTSKQPKPRSTPKSSPAAAPRTSAAAPSSAATSPAPKPRPVTPRPKPSATAPSSAPAGTPTVSRTTMAQLIINEHRQNFGMPKLARYPGMDSFAQEWAEKMDRTGTLKHSDLGPYKGEVIASGAYTAEAAVQLWMNSPAHKQIILNPSYTMTGIGYSDGYWVMVFS